MLNQVHYESPQHMFWLHSAAVIEHSSQKHLRGGKGLFQLTGYSLMLREDRAGPGHRNHGEMLLADSRADLCSTRILVEPWTTCLGNGSSHNRLSSPISTNNPDSHS